MKAKLYTTVTTRIERSKSRNPQATKVLVDQGTGTLLNYVPVPEAEQIEELLGTFPCTVGGQFIIVNTPRKSIRLNAQTLTKQTDVNRFRVEMEEELRKEKRK